MIFKSNIDNFRKERTDLKNNTVRVVDESDERFKQLREMHDRQNINGFITIQCVETGDVFSRKIRDVTFFQLKDCPEQVCITWEEK